MLLRVHATKVGFWARNQARRPSPMGRSAPVWALTTAVRSGHWNRMA